MRKMDSFFVKKITALGLLGLSMLAAISYSSDNISQLSVTPESNTIYQAKVAELINLDQTNLLHRTMAYSAISKMIFESKDNAIYRERLEYLSSQMKSHPDSLAELTQYLQSIFLKKHPLKTPFQSKQAMRSKASMAIGAVVMGLAVFKSPHKMLQKYKYYYSALPLIAASLGASNLPTEPDNESKQWISPAQVIYEAEIASPLTGPENDALYQAIGDALSLSAGSGFYFLAESAVKGAKVVNHLTSPLKIAPVALIASIAVSIMLDQVIEKSITEMRNQDYVSKIKNALDELIALSISHRGKKNPSALFQAHTKLKGLVANGINYTSYLSKALIESSKNMGQDFLTSQNELYADLTRDDETYLALLQLELAPSQNFTYNLDNPILANILTQPKGLRVNLKNASLIRLLANLNHNPELYHSSLRPGVRLTSLLTTGICMKSLYEYQAKKIPRSAFSFLVRLHAAVRGVTKLFPEKSGFDFYLMQLESPINDFMGLM